MKKTGKCPKCGAEDAVCIPKDYCWHVGGSIRVDLGPFSYVNITRYMCGNCGYMEEWIDSSEDVQKIKRRFGGYKIP
jgi:ribosomal protein S27AE